MAALDVETYLKTKAQALGRLGATVVFQIGPDSIILDGTKVPAVISLGSTEADCTIVITPEAATDFMNETLAGVTAITRRGLRIKGYAGRKEPMAVARRLEAILRSA